MTEYLTEQEQIEQIKNWIKQYGFTVLTGILLAVIVTTGWRFWQNYQNKILIHASSVYDEMLTLRAQNNFAGAVVQADKLMSHYPKTPYGQMAAFMLARDFVMKKNYDQAIEKLNWVIDHSHSKPMKQIARIRVARILLDENKPDAALEILNTTNDKSFNGLIDEVRGDAYSSKKDFTAARNAYAAALKELPNAEANRPILQMKYDNLAT